MQRTVRKQIQFRRIGAPVLVGGLVALALGVDVWLDARDDRNREQATLTLLLAEFEANTAAVGGNLTALERLEEAADWFLAVGNGPYDQVPAETMAARLTDAHASDFTVIRSFVLDSLASVRGYDLVSDPALNQKLLAWPLVTQGLSVDHAWFETHYDESLEPAVRAAFPLHLLATDDDGSRRALRAPRMAWDGAAPEALADRRLRARAARRHSSDLQDLHSEIVDELRSELGLPPSS